jgi:hypothetical protein
MSSLLLDIHSYFKEKFPFSEAHLFDEMLWAQIKLDDDILNIEIKDWTTIDITNKHGKSFNKEIMDLIVATDPTTPQSHVLVDALEILISNEYDAAGFVEPVDESEIKKSNMDFLYSELKPTLMVPSHDVYLISFGAKHIKNMNAIKQHNISNMIKMKYDIVFDARVIVSRKPSGTHNLRGTDEIIQKEMESGTNYETVVRRIVNSIETTGHRVIGIYCTAGHHRSVALAELIKKYLYPDAKITHLHINHK